MYHPPRPVEGMPRLHQEVLRRLLPLVDQEVHTRQAHGRRLADLVRGSTRLRPVRVPKGDASFLRYPILTPDAKLRSAEARLLGVMPGYPIGLAELGPLQHVIRNPDDRFPGARVLVEELMTLPTHSLLAERDFARLGRLVT